MKPPKSMGEIKPACFNCGYLHPGKISRYKCYSGDCPARRRSEAMDTLGSSREKTYKLPVVCWNCRWKGYIDYPFGKEVERSNEGRLLHPDTGKAIPCPKCGTHRLWS